MHATAASAAQRFGTAHSRLSRELHHGVNLPGFNILDWPKSGKADARGGKEARRAAARFCKRMKAR